jgi:hypothetical protein
MSTDATLQDVSVKKINLAGFVNTILNYSN